MTTSKIALVTLALLLSTGASFSQATVEAAQKANTQADCLVDFLQKNIPVFRDHDIATRAAQDLYKDITAAIPQISNTIDWRKFSKFGGIGIDAGIACFPDFAAAMDAAEHTPPTGIWVIDLPGNNDIRPQVRAQWGNYGRWHTGTGCIAPYGSHYLVTPAFRMSAAKPGYTEVIITSNPVVGCTGYVPNDALKPFRLDFNSGIIQNQE